MESNLVTESSKPKLNKKTISSAILKSDGSSGDSLRKIHGTISKLSGHVRKNHIRINAAEKRFEEVEKKISVKKEEEKKTENTEQLRSALIETNKTLEEIQKQLALDFKMRIDEEKQTLKKIRTDQEKKKIKAEESRLEKGVKKLGAAGGALISKVTSPVKGIFEKIKEFFGLILTNILLSDAYKWLQDEENRKLLDTIFDWIGKGFVPALIGIVGFKVFKWVRRLWRLGRFLLRIPGSIIKRLFGKRPPSPSGAGSKGSGSKGPTTKGGKPITGTRPPSGGNARVTYGQGSSPKGFKMPDAKPAGVKPTGIRGGISAGGIASGIRSVGIGIALDYAAKAAVDWTSDRIFGTEEEQLQKWVTRFNELSPEKKVLNIRKLQESAYEEILHQKSPFHMWDKFLAQGGETMSERKLRSDLNKLEAIGAPTDEKTLSQAKTLLKLSELGQEIPKGYKLEDGKIIKMSEGATVPGRGPGNVDSVSALLAPGEEVVRTSASMLFRPLLKDINDNAGRTYTKFAKAVDSLKSNSSYQSDVSEEYSKVFEDFNKSLKKQIEEQRRKKNKSRSSSSSSSSSRSPVRSAPSAPSASAPASSDSSSSRESTPQAATITPSGTPSSSADDKSIVPMESSIAPSMATPPNLTLPSSEEPKFSVVDLPVQDMGGVKSMPSLQKTATDVELISATNELNPYMKLSLEWYGIYM